MINSFKGRWCFLSNFHPCQITYQGITYPSVEHYYIAMKVKNDQMINGQYITAADCREWIAKIESPGMAKKIGQALKIRRDWEQVKLSIMEWGLREKFKDESLQEQLLQTGDDDIIEGNFWHDTFWGQCNCPKCGGKGENYLGKFLMMIRSELKTSTFNRDIL